MSEPNETTPTVFVVDDDKQMRDSLLALLDALGFTARGFPSAAAFLRFYRPHMSGCLIVDVRMPLLDGISMYRQMLSEGKRLPAVFITAHADVTAAVDAMKSGAIEFLEKPFDQYTLVDRVNKAIDIDRAWRQRDAQFRAMDSLIESLSEREQETLQLLLAGEPNKVIAAKLLISERAVEMRRASIMRKLKVRSLAELLDLAISHRLLAQLSQTQLNAPTHWLQ